MITKDRAEVILKNPSLIQGIKKYQNIMEKTYTTNVAEDLEFQKIYRDFYQMRRFYSDDFAGKYFQLLESLKDTRSSLSFQMVFEKVKQIQSTYEISFSSKLAHTVNSNIPIWDSIVTTKHFGLKAPSGKRDREQRMIERFEEYIKEYYKYMNSEEGRMLIAMFDSTYPESHISDVKKIDFILWQDR